MELKNPGEVFLGSLDSENYWQVFDKTEVKKKFTVDVKLITEMFDSGAPCLKFFYREPKETKYTFQPGQVIDLIDHHYEHETYWFDNGVWYMTHWDTEDLLDELDPREEEGE